MNRKTLAAIRDAYTKLAENKARLEPRYLLIDAAADIMQAALSSVDAETNEHAARACARLIRFIESE